MVYLVEPSIIKKVVSKDEINCHNEYLNANLFISVEDRSYKPIIESQKEK